MHLHYCCLYLGIQYSTTRAAVCAATARLLKVAEILQVISLEQRLYFDYFDDCSQKRCALSAAAGGVLGFGTLSAPLSMHSSGT